VREIISTAAAQIGRRAVADEDPIYESLPSPTRMPEPIVRPERIQSTNETGCGPSNSDITIEV
jgi:hypothetical protein